jgi:UDP-N-acetylmuramoylalanine--D-glutamate ligase
VWTEVELAYRLMPVPERLLGVTGTNGKTSTTEMIVSALAASGYDAAAAGNIGRPLVDVIAESHDAVVVELSSFQLHYVDRFRAHVGVLLNIAQDHLDWHGSFDAYAADKSKLFATQTYDDVAIHFDDGVCARAASAGSGRRLAFSPVRVPDGGAGVDDGWIVVPQGRVVAVADLHARGGAMIANAVAAAAAACALGADPARVGKGLASFEPGAHRMEHVVTIDDVDYVNDSKATNPHATLAALDGLDGVVLIAGGRNKGLDLSVLGRAGAAIRTVVSIGESAEEIVRAFPETPVRRAPTMEDAVRLAARLARPGDTVLLSPACASFDMFPDYRARGEAFRAAVRGLAAGGETT